MSCDRPFEIVAYVKGELDEVERGPARAHIEVCASCRQEVERIERLLGALGGMSRVEPSPGFHRRVCEAFAAAHLPAGASLWETIRAAFSGVPAWSVSAAAYVVLLSIAAAIFLAPEGPRDDEAAIRVQPREGTEPGESSRHLFIDPNVEAGTPRRALVMEDLKDWRRLKVADPTAPFVANRTIHKEALRNGNGGEGTGPAVERALAWLAGKQRSDGAWPVAELGGQAPYEVGVTGLALLAFLGDGHTPASGPYADTVRRGIEFLRSQQKVTGRVGGEGGNVMVNHAIAALALFECHRMTGDEALALPASCALSFSMRAQNEAGGWDYQAGGTDTDASVGGWQIHLLRLAREFGNDEVVSSLILARERVLELTDVQGRVGYRARLQFPNGPYTLTAIGAFSYLMSSATPEPSLVEKYKRVLQEGLDAHPCVRGGRKANDLIFWYFGSLALRQVGGAVWDQWNGPLKPALLSAQQGDGSWPADFDRWSGHGGQVYTTAMAALIFETYYRYQW